MVTANKPGKYYTFKHNIYQPTTVYVQMQQSGRADLAGMVGFFPGAGGAGGMAIALSCFRAFVLR